MSDENAGKPSSSAEERQVRLASIVAIDVAGFSTMSEKDQRKAASNIEALRARIDAVARRNEGRIFNTAGDGFMLEFSSAGAALGAINELLDTRPKKEPAIRVGAHVGDVVVTVNNDLLGHGVNVAARLQSLAPPNTALVSGEFRSMARNSPSAVFQSRGRQPLENIDQRIATFAIIPQKVRTRKLLARGAVSTMFIAATALVAVYAGPSLLRYVDSLDLFAKSKADIADAAPPVAQAPVVEEPAASTSPPIPTAGQAVKDCDTCPDLIVLPGGTFTMGSPANERNRSAIEGPQHEVTIKPFAIGVDEITFAEWDACLADNGCGGFSPSDHGWGRGRRPVIGVSWSDAQAYIQWLNRKTGKNLYRLPTEAEWEYAARGGTSTAYPFGDRLARGQATYGVAKTDPVGAYAANAFGLFDTAGNAWEWVQDCYKATYADAPLDGGAVAIEPCQQRAYRGGGYADPPSLLRSANRRRAAPGLRDSHIGFRVARDLQ